MKPPFAVLAALAVVACQPKPAAEPPAVAARTSVSDFRQPITARGNEPFWAVRIEGTRLTLLLPGAPDVVFQAPGATISPGRAVWQARAADGRTLKLSVFVSPCSDGMSDLSYPMAAEAVLENQTHYGCAAKTAELPREGG